jgi:tryptophanase
MKKSAKIKLIIQSLLLLSWIIVFILISIYIYPTITISKIIGIIIYCISGVCIIYAICDKLLLKIILQIMGYVENKRFIKRMEKLKKIKDYYRENNSYDD